MISFACKYLCKKSQDLKYGYWMLIFYHLKQSFFVLRFDCFFNFFGCTIILLSVFCCKPCVSHWVFHNKFVFSYIKMCEKRFGCWLIVVIIFIKREITHTKVLWIRHTLKSGDRVHVRFFYFFCCFPLGWACDDDNDAICEMMMIFFAASCWSRSWNSLNVVDYMIWCVYVFSGLISALVSDAKKKGLNLTEFLHVKKYLLTFGFKGDELCTITSVIWLCT